jgi:hypothetical protein
MCILLQYEHLASMTTYLPPSNYFVCVCDSRSTDARNETFPNKQMDTQRTQIDFASFAI